MRSLGMALLTVLLSTPAVLAGEIYGTITDGTRPVGAGLKVDVNASGKVYTVETDKFGAYRMFVKEKGKCTLTVHLKESAAAAEVFSYDKSTRYDWVFGTQSGKALLRRK
jgi:hypothetical protein